MGTFDHVDYKDNCHACGKPLTWFQTREGTREEKILDVKSVRSFYSSCADCSAWHDYFVEEGEVRVELNPYKDPPPSEKEVAKQRNWELRRDEDLQRRNAPLIDEEHAIMILDAWEEFRSNGFRLYKDRQKHEAGREDSFGGGLDHLWLELQSCDFEVRSNGICRFRLPVFVLKAIRDALADKADLSTLYAKPHRRVTVDLEEEDIQMLCTRLEIQSPDLAVKHVVRHAAWRLLCSSDRENKNEKI